jgi:hypothetical protein
MLNEGIPGRTAVLAHFNGKAGGVKADALRTVARPGSLGY